VRRPELPNFTGSFQRDGGEKLGILAVEKIAGKKKASQQVRIIIRVCERKEKFQFSEVPGNLFGK